MKTIAILRPSPQGDMSRLPELIGDEETAVWRHSVSGELREISYNLASFGSVVLTLETETPARAVEIVDGLPLVANGILAPEYLPLKPYDGLANLFDPSLAMHQQLPGEWQTLEPARG